MTLMTAVTKSYTAKKSNLFIPEKEIAKTYFQIIIYIFPKSFMIFRQEPQDAAVSLWTNIISKEIMITNMMPVPRIQPELPTMTM
jgi:hypothetical protein